MPLKTEMKKFGNKVKKAVQQAVEDTGQFVEENALNPLANNTTINMARNFAAQMQQSRNDLMTELGPDLMADLQTWLPTTGTVLSAKLAEVDSNVAKLNDMVHNQDSGLVHMQDKGRSDIQPLFEEISKQKTLCEQNIQDVHTLGLDTLKSTVERMKLIQQIAVEAKARFDTITEGVVEECTAWTQMPSSAPNAIQGTVTDPMRAALAELEDKNTALQQLTSTGIAEIQSVDAAYGNSSALQSKSLEIEPGIRACQAVFDTKFAGLQQKINTNRSNRELMQARLAAAEEEMAAEQLAQRLGLGSQLKLNQ